MDLPTYTNIWRIEKRLYKLYDFRLPQPLSVVTLGVFLGVLAVWTLLMSLLNVPLKTPWHVLWIVPPLVITFLATRPVIEGKRLTELLLSQIRFLAEARVYTRLAPEHEPAEVRVEVRVWHRDPDLPLPDVSKSRRAKSAAKQRGGLRAPAVGATEPEPLGPARAPDEIEVTEVPAQVAEREAPGERVAAVAAPERPRGKRAPEPLKLDRGRAEPNGGPKAASRAARPPEPEEEPQKALHESPHESPHEASAPEAGEEPAEVSSARVPDRTKGRPERETGPERAAAPGVVDEAPEPEPLPEEPEPLPVEPVRAQPPKLAVPEPGRAEPAPEPERDRAAAASAVGAAGAEPVSAPKRGLGIKVLNYFGFALNKAQPKDAPEPQEAFEDVPERDTDGSLTRPTSLERAQAADRARERDELRRENEEWLNAYRSSEASAPGASADPAGEFDEIYDPGGGDDAPGTEEGGSRPDKEARRRAEEMMAAPAPEEPHTEPPVDEGVRVVEPAPEMTEEAVSAEGVAEGPVERDENAHRRLRGRIQGKQVERRLTRERERVAPPAPRQQAQATGAPATPQEAAEQAVGPAGDERGRRPHAAPWELPEHGGQKRAEDGAGDRAQDGVGDGAEAGAANGAEAATETGAKSVKSAQEERLEVLDRHLERLEEQEREADPVPPQPQFAESEDVERTKRRREGWFTEERAERRGRDDERKAEAPTEPVPAEPAPAEAAVSEAASPQAGPLEADKPDLQLDHGTGEHESFTATAEGPREAEEPEGPGEPVWNTPPKPVTELDHGTGEHESYAATAGAEDASPEEGSDVGSEAGAAVPPAERPAKPATELDHGTGEHESYAATAEPSVSAADDETDTADKAGNVVDTGEDTGKAALEDAAKASQPTESPQPSAEQRATTDTVGDRDRKAASKDEADARPAQGEKAASEPSKPVMQLDHGTGEHESFGYAAVPPWPGDAGRADLSEARASERGQEDNAIAVSGSTTGTGSGEAEEGAADERAASPAPSAGSTGSARSAPSEGRPSGKAEDSAAKEGGATASGQSDAVDGPAAQAADGGQPGAESQEADDKDRHLPEAAIARPAADAPAGGAAASEASETSEAVEGPVAETAETVQAARAVDAGRSGAVPEVDAQVEGGKAGDVSESAAARPVADAPAAGAAASTSPESADGSAAQAADAGRSEGESKADNDAVPHLPEPTGVRSVTDAPVGGTTVSEPSESVDGSAAETVQAVQAARTVEAGRSGAVPEVDAQVEGGKAGDVSESGTARPTADAPASEATASGPSEPADGSDTRVSRPAEAGQFGTESEAADDKVRDLPESTDARSAADAREAGAPVGEAADGAQTWSAADSAGEPGSQGVEATPAVPDGVVSDPATAVSAQSPSEAGVAAAVAGVADVAEPAKTDEGAEAAAAAPPASPPPAPAKPVTELDHGTGEHESYAATAHPDEEPHRATDDDLTAAEEAALRARQAASRRAAQEPAAPEESFQRSQRSRSAESNDILERSRRLSRSMRSNPTGSQRALPHEPKHTSRSTDSRDTDPAESTAETTTETAAERPAERPAARSGETTRQAPESGSAQSGDGVFSKVAENARRLNNLFGQDGDRGKGASEPGSRSGEVVELAPDGSGTGTGSDTDDKPELQLDHGTGEQRRLTPADRARAAAEAAGTDTGATRGWRRLARVVTGGSNAPKHELPAGDVARLRMDIGGPRSVVVLGCTGGAGQTITSLMLGHTLASYRDERVVAVDVNPGVNGLSRRIRSETPETLTSLLANAESVDGYADMRRYTTQTGTGLEVVSTLDDPYVQTLDDRDYAGLTELLATHYEVALLDPAATGVARALPTADGLVLVAPASADAARSVAMTFEWLDGHGYAALRSRSVVVINGVSKRSLGDVDEAEQVARGRCRAIVRVPWDDHVAQGRLGDTGNLRSSTRRAHAALGGVLMHAVSPAGQQPPNRAPSEARR